MSQHTPVSCEEVCEVLQKAFPNGVSSVDLLCQCGPCAKTRIGDLRRQGWKIKTSYTAGVASYRLLSRIKADPDPGYAGIVLRYGERSGWKHTTHMEAQHAGQVPSDVLQEALDAAFNAYRSIVSPYLPVQELDWLDEVATILPAKTPLFEDAGIDELFDSLDSLSGGAK